MTDPMVDDILRKVLPAGNTIATCHIIKAAVQAAIFITPKCETEEEFKKAVRKVLCIALDSISAKFATSRGLLGEGE